MTLQQFFTPEEKEFIAKTQTAVTADRNQHRVISEIYSSKLIKQAADDLRNSNETLVNKMIGAADRIGQSSDRNAHAMTWLTAALVFLGVVQAAVQIADSSISQSTSDMHQTP